MCGTYTIVPGEKFYQRFDLKNRLDSILRTSFNVKPGYIMPVVSNGESREVTMMKWGLIPSWTKEPAIGYKMINARGETVTEKAAYRRPFQKQRCLVPSSGFYEWQKNGKEKIPYFLRLKSNSLFSFAGLFDIWKDAEGREIKSYTIITSVPNELVAKIHDRMPVILDEEDEDKWLNEKTETGSLLKLLKPFPESEMDAYPVSKAVNFGENDSEDLIKPVKIEKQARLF